MKNYKIFKHADGRVEAVKQGWSWPGFFFGLIWALVKKLWAVAGILFTIGAVMFIISIYLEPSGYHYGYEYQKQMEVAMIWGVISNIISLVICIYIGIKGNVLRENSLLSKGYEFIGTVNAPNPDAAVIEAMYEPVKAENKSSDTISHI